MKRLLAVLSVFAIGACAQKTSEQTPAQTPAAPDEADILAAVDAFFLALAAPDGEAMTDLVAPGATNVISSPEDDKPLQYNMAQELLAGLTDPAFPKLRERYWSPTVLERGELAVVWAPYIIDIDDKFSHCGVDIFSLSKHEEGWKIDGISFTREPSACEALGYTDDSATRPDFSVLDAKE